MNCYLCFVEGSCHHQPAHAICQQCGIGACSPHLVVMSMMSLGGSSERILCRRCYTELFPPAPPSRSALLSPSEGRWWDIRRWFKRKAAQDLPAPEEAVAAAEHLLKRQGRTNKDG